MNDIEQTKFFGRTSILGLLRRRVIDLKEGYRQNIALLGPRYIGKSAVLKEFLSNLDDEVITIHLDFENKDFHYMFNKFVGNILYEFSRTQSLPLYDTLPLLVQSTQKFIPQTIAEIKRIQMSMNKGKIAESYRALITLPEIFTTESKKCCVIVLDEFHGIEDLDIDHAFAEMGKKIMTQRRCLYIVTSSYPQLAKKILSERLSLLFGNFEMIEMKPLGAKTSQALIEYYFENVQISQSLRDFLVDFTGGHPLYLHLICQELVNLSIVYNQDEVFTPLLSEAIEHVVFDRWGALNRHFEITMERLSTGKNNRMVGAILGSLSNGHNKMQGILDDLGFKKTVLAQKLKYFIEEGIIVKNGNFYQFNDKLFKYWMKYVFQTRVTAIHQDVAKQKSRFKDELTRTIVEFKVHAKKGLPARIVELLDCFDNDAFDINGRRYKLPTFHEIFVARPERDSSSNLDVIQARTDEGTWLIALKKDLFEEQELNAFLEESKKIDEKLKKRVIISLSDLDANARLKALQERVWIWNQGELNTLLNLYDKPYIGL